MSANILLLLAGVCLAFWHIAARLSMRTISPIEAQIVFSLVAIAFIPLYAKGAFREGINWTGVGFAVLACAITTVATIAYSTAITHKDVSSAVVLTGGYPALTVLLAVPILGESLTWQKVIGMVLVISGVMVAR